MGPRLLGATATVVALVGGVLCAGCGSKRSAGATTPVATAPAALVAQARPIGRAPGFHPAARGPVTGECRATLGARHGVHVEIFAADQVVLLAAGIGTRPPRHRSEGRIVAAACYGSLVTLEPTGVVLVRAGARLRLGSVFRAWGQPLSDTRLASFSAGPRRKVAVFVNGRRWAASPGAVPLRRHAEIVLEVGPPVPPHSHYTFPPGA